MQLVSVGVATRASLVLSLFVSLAACQAGKEPAPQTTTGTLARSPSPITPSGAAPSGTPAASGDLAEVGKPAPDFTLRDLDGAEVRLSSFKGKTVVLEWFNPGCPFVKAAHTKGSLKDEARRQTKNGVVWLAINSAAPGKQGHGVEANRDGARRFAMEHPILLDESGVVGKQYGATNTPHMMVVDDKGTLVYRGAIDNSPDGEGESAPGGKLVNYVDGALADLGAGKPLTTGETRAYGCSVKYAR
jgi:peroxiredoxin